MKRRDFLEIGAIAGTAVWLNNFEKASAQTAAQSFELEEMTVMQFQEAMKSGKLTSKIITQKYLDRIREIDPKINSIIELNPDALQIAEQMDKERKNGKVRSMLHGIPLLLKDNIETAAVFADI